MAPHRSPETRYDSYSLLVDGWKLIHRPNACEIELYDLRADPEESRDLEGPDQAERIDAMIRTLQEMAPTPRSRR